MRLLVINSAPCDEEFAVPISQCLEQAGIASEIVGFDAIPTDLSPFSAVIISASPKGDDIIEAQIPYYAWIENYNKPVLGICHGHQMLGVIYGADLIREGQSEEGDCFVITELEHPIFAGLGQCFGVEQHHDYSISLPNGFKLLASSGRCRVQAMAHPSKPIVSVQFHAEKKPEIILNFVRMAGEMTGGELAS